MLELQEIHKNFDGLAVIRGVNLTVPKGERHAIIGPNGAGKTTLVNIISGRYGPTRGRLLLEKRDVTGRKPHEMVRRGVSRSFQIINMFRDMTVLENMRNAVLARHGLHLSAVKLLAGLREISEETERLLDTFGLGDVANQSARELPYGSQRSLEIGLALGLDPSLIILDEPAAGMSAAETRDLIGLIKRVTERRTLVFIEHDMDVVFSIADRVSVLHHGQIIAQGSPEEIRKNPQVRDVYLGYRNA